MSIRNTLFAATFIFILGAPLAIAEETPATADHATHHPQSNLWSGVYRGLLPCDDCYGVKTELALNKNGTYLMITQNTGKSQRDFVEKGKFSWEEASQTVTLTPRKEGAASHQYLVNDKQLIKLDEHGNRYTKQPERYLLNKVEMKETGEDKHTGH